MIHVATVHHRSDAWIALQRRHLDAAFTEPYRLYASTEGIDPAWARSFDVVVPSLGGHEGKLNLLARVVLEHAEPHDQVVFLDGDAFPVRELDGVIRDGLSRAPLMAVRRDENVGDTVPHPCFCATTAAFWAEIHGDWASGAPIETSDGRVRTHPGSNLARALRHAGVEWLPVLRSHSIDRHPLYFGVYGSAIYHHGAGFKRYVWEWVDEAMLPWADGGRWVGAPVRGALRAVLRSRRSRANRRASRRVHRLLVDDPDYLRRLIAPGTAPAGTDTAPGGP